MNVRNKNEAVPRFVLDEVEDIDYGLTTTRGIVTNNH